MGMWYGIEIISHRHDSPGETEYSTDCPVIYFFEDKNRTGPPSLYDNIHYGQTYGTPMYDANYQEKYRQQQQQGSFLIVKLAPVNCCIYRSVLSHLLQLR